MLLSMALTTSMSGPVAFLAGRESDEQRIVEYNGALSISPQPEGSGKQHAVEPSAVKGRHRVWLGSLAG